MADKHTLQFVTGNSSDSQAPRVEKLYAGPTAQALSSTSPQWLQRIMFLMIPIRHLRSFIC